MTELNSPETHIYMYIFTRLQGSTVTSRQFISISLNGNLIVFMILQIQSSPIIPDCRPPGQQQQKNRLNQNFHLSYAKKC